MNKNFVKGRSGGKYKKDACFVNSPFWQLPKLNFNNLIVSQDMLINTKLKNYLSKDWNGILALRQILTD